MGRKKINREEQLLLIMQELGWEKTEYLLNLYKSILKPKNKKSLGTDPDPKAQEKTAIEETTE